jgi:hypothetical protein
MKTRGRYIIIVTFVAFAKAGAVLAAAPCAPAAAPADPFAAPSTLAYPNFCDIPPKPTDIRPAAAFKTQVVGTRVAGAVVVRQTAPETFTLSGTEGFADSAKSEAAPPPPQTAPIDADTEAFVKQSKAKATPPRKHR